MSENLFGILANRWRIFFANINLEPKYVEDVIFTALILHNMLIKSSNSVNTYRPSSFADTVLEDEEISEGEWRANLIPDSSLQVSRTGHNASLYAKSVREEFMDYFVNDRGIRYSLWHSRYTMVIIANVWVSLRAAEFPIC